VSNDGREGNDGLVSLLAGVGVGMLVGALAALLLAPQPGTETRAQIRGSADDAILKLKDSMDSLRAKVDEVAASTRDAVTSRLGASSENGDGEGAALSDLAEGEDASLGA